MTKTLKDLKRGDIAVRTWRGAAHPVPVVACGPKWVTVAPGPRLRRARFDHSGHPEGDSVARLYTEEEYAMLTARARVHEVFERARSRLDRLERALPIERLEKLSADLAALLDAAEAP